MQCFDFTAQEATSNICALEILPRFKQLILAYHFTFRRLEWQLSLSGIQRTDCRLWRSFPLFSCFDLDFFWPYWFSRTRADLFFLFHGSGSILISTDALDLLWFLGILISTESLRPDIPFRGASIFSVVGTWWMLRSLLIPVFYESVDVSRTFSRGCLALTATKLDAFRGSIGNRDFSRWARLQMKQLWCQKAMPQCEAQTVK